MKSSYELAMERLNQTAPAARLTAGQKKELAELESLYAAKKAEREIGLKSEITKAISHGQREEAAKLQEQLTHERKVIQAELDEKKEKIRQGKK
jgi:hypothetical protein